MSKRIFLLILIVLLIRQVVFSLFNPMFQGPDEIQHLVMVSQMDKNGFGIYHDPPSVTWFSFERSYDYVDDYYLQKGILCIPSKKPAYVEGQKYGIKEEVNLQKKHFDEVEGSDRYKHNTYSYPPAYYYPLGKVLGLFRLTEPTLITYQYAIRIFGGMFLALFVVLWFFTVKNLFSGRIFYFVFGSLLFHPYLVFIFSVSNNDIALFVFYTGLLLSLYKLSAAHEKKSFYFSFVCSLVFSLFLVASKVQGVLYLVFTVTPLLFYFLVINRHFKKSLLLFLNLSAAFVFYQATKLLTGAVLGGDPRSDGISLREYLDLYILNNQLTGTLSNLFGQFGWCREAVFKESVYTIFAIIILLSAIFSFLYFIIKIREKNTSSSEFIVVLLFLASVFYFVFSMFFQYVGFKKYGPFIQGRYFINLLISLYLVCGVIFLKLYQAKHIYYRHLTRYLGTFLFTSLFVLSNYSLWLIIERYYVVENISAKELVYRNMQYKPEFFKNDLIFFSIILLHVIGQLTVFGYFVRKIFIEEVIEEVPGGNNGGK